MLASAGDSRELFSCFITPIRPGALATRDIAAGEELTYCRRVEPGFFGDQAPARWQCLCGCSNCRGWI